MAEPWTAVMLSVIAVSLLGFAGALTLTVPALRRHAALLLLIALAAGTLLGDAFFHLLPEAVEAADGFPMSMGLAVLAGFLVFYLFETGLRWGHAHGEAMNPGEHAHAAEGAARVAPFAWLNLSGDALHNLVDGAIIAAAYLVDASLGIATTIAVALHEVPQELGDFAVLLRAGLRPARALLYNFGSALFAVLGGALVLLADVPASDLEGLALPFIAGAFVYIAAADLVPELHHHAQARYAPLVLGGFLAGLGAMAALLRFEFA